MSAIVESASDVAPFVKEPKAIPSVSKVADPGTTMESAYATAESVASYYTSMERALTLVDRILGVVSNFAEVSVSTTWNALVNLFLGPFCSPYCLPGLVFSLPGEP